VGGYRHQIQDAGARQGVGGGHCSMVVGISRLGTIGLLGIKR